MPQKIIGSKASKEENKLKPLVSLKRPQGSVKIIIRKSSEINLADKRLSSSFRSKYSGKF